VTHLGRTRNQIEKLRDENDKLRLTLQNRKTADAQLKQLKGVLNLAGTAGYDVVNAKVISQGSTTSFTQTITIDAGTSSGVRANMTVLSGYGLVGVVKFAYRDSALVQLASDPAFKIGARIAGTQQIGILSGQGTRKGVLQLLDNTTQVRKGDALLARGSQNGRPFVPGVPIGEVTSVDISQLLVWLQLLFQDRLPILEIHLCHLSLALLLFLLSLSMQHLVQLSQHPQLRSNDVTAPIPLLLSHLLHCLLAPRSCCDADAITSRWH
jgi:cell shape-determining protein MreC